MAVIYDDLNLFLFLTDFLNTIFIHLLNSNYHSGLMKLSNLLLRFTCDTASKDLTTLY